MTNTYEDCKTVENLCAYVEKNNKGRNHFTATKEGILSQIEKAIPDCFNQKMIFVMHDSRKNDESVPGDMAFILEKIFIDGDNITSQSLLEKTVRILISYRNHDSLPSSEHFSKEDSKTTSIKHLELLLEQLKNSA